MSQESPAPKRRLILLRHAKSAWPEGVTDHDRPLAGRGRKAAPVMGAYLAHNDLLPDLVLVSTARRAQETWSLVRDALPPSVVKCDVSGLYEASCARIADILYAVEPSFETVMLIGHNPGLEDLALLLACEGDPAAQEKISEKFPTAGLAVIDFSAPRWADIAPNGGYLERFVTPGSLV